MFGQSLLSAFGSAACTTDTDQLFTTDVQTTSLATYQLNNATTSIPSNTYPGTASNITYAAGKFGNAAVFNGSSSEIVAANSILPSSGGFAISWWQKTTQADNTYGYTIDTGGASLGNGLYISTHRTDVGFIVGFKNGSVFQSTIPYSSVERTQWTHFCFSWDGTTSANAFKIYKNNVATSFTSTVTNGGSAYPFRIGRSYNGTDWFGGSIDQVRIFNTALPQSAVTALYNETTTTATYDYVDYVNANPNSVAYYKMSDATDQLGNYNGTATNVNFNTEGKFGFAGAFNGSSSTFFLASAGTSVTNYDSDFSVSMWFNVSSWASAASSDFLWTGGGTRITNLTLTGSNGLMFDLWNSGSNIVSTTGLSENVWYNLVITRSKTAGMVLYINGASVDTNSFTGNAGSLSSQDSLGTYWNNTRNNFTGKIDQVRIYDAALSAANVTALYNEIECPETEFLANYLVIAGGGGTTHGQGSGGGAGGYRTSYGTSGGGASAETILRLDKSVAYTVTVGAGGIGNTGSNQLLGGQGQDSIFSSITSAGGGAGTAQSVGYPSGPGGQLGGSGGGGARNNTSPGAGTANQGFAGGAGNNSANGYAGGGGGGASSVGIAANSTSAGNGGNGISSTITGTAVSRAGGGGGTVYDGAIGVGTSGGGSGGTSFNTPFTAPTPGTANTGGGGGGGNDASKGQDGGSGVVILRYNTANVSSFAVTGTLNTPTPSIVGTDSVLIFTTGTGTVTFS
jgi:hypothetical protein